MFDNTGELHCLTGYYRINHETLVNSDSNGPSACVYTDNVACSYCPAEGM